MRYHIFDSMGVEGGGGSWGMVSLVGLIAETVGEEYCMIEYADFDIIMCKKDQYLNMTKVVALDVTSGGNSKELRKWIDTDPAKNIINILNQEINKGLADEAAKLRSYYSITDGPNDLRGTYCHKLLVPHILSWCSARFAVKVSKIVNMYYEHMGDIKTAELNRKHDEIISEIKSSSERHISEIKSSSERQLADAQTKHDRQIEEIKLNRKEVVDRHNVIVRKFNNLNADNKFLKSQNNTLLESTKGLMNQLMSMNIKNDKLRIMVVDINTKISSIPVHIIDPNSRTFVVGNKPDKMTTTFIILTVIKLTSPDISTFYTVNRIQYRNHKSAIARSLSKVLSCYTDPVFTYYHPFFESAASAVITWNIIKSTFEVESGCILRTNETNFHKLIKRLQSIIIDPKDELKILSDELIKLQNSTDQADKDFLAELESDELF